MSFDDSSGDQPKREAMLDALRRAYPNAAALGVRAAQEGSAPRQEKTLTIAIHRNSGSDGKEIAAAAGALLHKLDEGRVRSRPSVAWDRWSDTRVDWLTYGDNSLLDPGDALRRRRDVGHGAAAKCLLARSAGLFRIPLEKDGEVSPEILLGGLFGALINAGLIEHKSRRILAARKELLERCRYTSPR